MRGLSGSNRTPRHAQNSALKREHGGEHDGALRDGGGEVEPEYVGDKQRAEAADLEPARVFRQGGRDHVGAPVSRRASPVCLASVKGDDGFVVGLKHGNGGRFGHD